MGARLSGGCHAYKRRHQFPVNKNTYCTMCRQRIRDVIYTSIKYNRTQPTIILADRTARTMTVYWYDNVVCLSVCLSVCLPVCPWRCASWLSDIHRHRRIVTFFLHFTNFLRVHLTAKVSEQVNRKYPPRNIILQLSTPYTDPAQIFFVLNETKKMDYSFRPASRSTRKLGIVY